MILSIVRKTKSKGKILTSDKMEVDENLLSLWLLNRMPVTSIGKSSNFLGDILSVQEPTF